MMLSIIFTLSIIFLFLSLTALKRAGRAPSYVHMGERPLTLTEGQRARMKLHMKGVAYGPCSIGAECLSGSLEAPHEAAAHTGLEPGAVRPRMVCRLR
jgi:hypothetical protein